MVELNFWFLTRIHDVFQQQRMDVVNLPDGFNYLGFVNNVYVEPTDVGSIGGNMAVGYLFNGKLHVVFFIHRNGRILDDRRADINQRARRKTNF